VENQDKLHEKLGGLTSHPTINIETKNVLSLEKLMCFDRVLNTLNFDFQLSQRFEF
jgi:hypothetical protein